MYYYQFSTIVYSFAGNGVMQGQYICIRLASESEISIEELSDIALKLKPEIERIKNLTIKNIFIDEVKKISEQYFFKGKIQILFMTSS